jgi:hypothetical protein
MAGTRDGEPVGRPWPTPHVQVTAVSEDQTDNVFRALLPMIQLGALAADIPDTGLTRINLPSGGPDRAGHGAARSRLGQRVTFVVQDQTESWLKSNGGHALADNQRRGLAGMGGRFLSTPNAWDPIEDSVAQRTGESKAPGVYHDDADPGPGSIRNKAERRRMLKKVYGDAATKPRPDAPWEPWIDLDRIDGEIEALLEYDPAQAERWFLNRKLASEGASVRLRDHRFPWTVTRRFRSSLSPPRPCGVRVRMCRSRRCGGSRWRLTATRWASWGDGPVTSRGRGIMGSCYMSISGLEMGDAYSCLPDNVRSRMARLQRGGRRGRGRAWARLRGVMHRRRCIAPAAMSRRNPTALSSRGSRAPESA